MVIFKTLNNFKSFFSNKSVSNQTTHFKIRKISFRFVFYISKVYSRTIRECLLNAELTSWRVRAWTLVILSPPRDEAAATWRLRFQLSYNYSVLPIKHPFRSANKRGARDEVTEGQGGESRQPSTHLKSKGEEATGLEYSTGSQGGHFLRGWGGWREIFLRTAQLVLRRGRSV